MFSRYGITVFYRPLSILNVKLPLQLHGWIINMLSIRDNILSGQLRTEAYEHLKIATDLFKKSMEL